MDFELEILKWGAYVVAGVLGWFVRVLWTAQEKMRNAFNELEKNLPIAYVPRDQLKDIIRELKDSFKETIIPVINKLEKIEERMSERRHTD